MFKIRQKVECDQFVFWISHSSIYFRYTYNTKFMGYQAAKSAASLLFSRHITSLSVQMVCFVQQPHLLGTQGIRKCRDYGISGGKICNIRLVQQQVLMHRAVGTDGGGSSLGSDGPLHRDLLLNKTDVADFAA